MTVPVHPAHDLGEGAARRPSLPGVARPLLPADAPDPLPVISLGASTPAAPVPGSSAARAPIPARGEAGPVQAVPVEDPASWCGSLVRAVVEALTGSRPTAQLGRWLTADLYEALARRAGLAVRIKGRPSLVRQAVVRHVHVCRLSPLVAEASVVVHDGTRVRAAAVRVEAHRGRWRATALELG